MSDLRFVKTEQLDMLRDECTSLGRIPERDFGRFLSELEQSLRDLDAAVSELQNAE